MPDTSHLERGLVIRRPWVDLIAEGEKTWELRRRSTTVRGRLGLIAGGTGTIVGEADLVDVLGPFQPDELHNQRHKHCVPDAYVDSYAGPGRLYAWVLKGAVRYDTPVPYEHPPGAVIFVKLKQ